MVDSSTQPSTAQAPAGNGQQKSPLDILEEILNDSKKAGGSHPGGDATQPSVADDSAQVEQAQQAQQQLQREEVHARDQQQLQQQLTELQQAYQTPQYQEAVRQKTEKQHQEDQHKSDTDGYEIHQLEHTKIDVDPNATT